eukprot:6205931-Pleurochrysis_carterae.AAC.1
MRYIYSTSGSHGRNSLLSPMGQPGAGGIPSTRRKAPMMPVLFVRGIHAVYGHKEPGWIRASYRSCARSKG